jgi:hypothetical protein
MFCQARAGFFQTPERALKGFIRQLIYFYIKPPQLAAHDAVQMNLNSPRLYEPLCLRTTRKGQAPPGDSDVSGWRGLRHVERFSATLWGCVTLKRAQINCCCAQRGDSAKFLLTLRHDNPRELHLCVDISAEIDRDTTEYHARVRE